MFRVAVLFCAVLALAKGWSTDVSQCIVHSGPLPINTYIQDCDTQPCLLPHGQVVDINTIFIAPRTIHKMQTLATAFLLFVPLPYDLGESADTCNFLINANCPVQQNQVILNKLRLPNEDYMSVGTQLPLEIRIVDENDEAVVCFRVLIRITVPVGQFGAQNATMTV